VPSLVVVGADDAPFLAASDYMRRKSRAKRSYPAAGHAVNIDQRRRSSTRCCRSCRAAAQRIRGRAGQDMKGVAFTALG